MGYIFDFDALTTLAEESAGSYINNHPFPHEVFDDFLPPDVVDQVLREFPDASSSYWHPKITPTSRKLSPPKERKEMLMPDVIRRTIWQLNSFAFLQFLTRLTTIENLLPDPYLEGAGVHQVEPGGYLKIHADFNKHPKLGLDRRINVLIYLNRDWRPQYGGYLELWSRDMSRCVRKIAPLAGRCVVFNTTDCSFHGHPDPLACPTGMTRKSIAMYYYTNGLPFEEQASPHTTLYQTRPSGD